ncbi:MAG: hypothetical protein EBR94_01205 [Bacteroidetes bacterium]|nr:hypothetical protein [Bacteroidota bacterium]
MIAIFHEHRLALPLRFFNFDEPVASFSINIFHYWNAIIAHQSFVFKQNVFLWYDPKNMSMHFCVTIGTIHDFPFLYA